MKQNTNKTILFNTKEETERFINLYGGFIYIVTGYDYRYYGDKIKGKVMVMIRNSKEDIEEITKCIGLQKKKYNNKTVYVYN